MTVWRNKYILVSGLNFLGEIDTTIGTTKSYSEGKASKGSIQYNFDTITSADQLLQLGIV
ncbi:hypothetical protein [Pseudocolwellia agarivorans]|uniref:hypothetical protein n=1 Tax=Pseudocolwellia agarivorans TaxID=1911682 RepID=UPI00098492D9|nr:hypothetical protein [Pseudocolwellia agarivorans]